MSKAPLSGGSATAVTAPGTASPCTIGGRGLDAIAVNNANAYWSAAEGLMKVPVAGGSPTVLAPGSGCASAITADDANVYWIDSLGRVLKMPVNGGSANALTPDVTSGGCIAEDGVNAYWIDGNRGQLMNAPIAGGPPTAAGPHACSLVDFALDATSIYWLDEWGGLRGEAELWKASKETSW